MRGERTFIYQVLKQYQFLIDKNAYCISGNFSWGSNFRFFLQSLLNCKIFNMQKLYPIMFGKKI